MTAPFTLIHGDSITEMSKMPPNSVDAVVTDPPYGIRFMGKAWDGADIDARAERRRGFASHAPDAGPNGGHKSIAAEAGKYELTPAAMRAFQEFTEEWAREAFRVLKPGGYLLSFASARTYHRMASGIEDAGFEIRDQIMWIFGSGFPKSLDVSKAIDKAAGADRAGTADMVRGGSRAARGGSELVGGGSIEAAKWKELTAPATDAAREWEGWGTALKPAHEPICVARKPLIGTVAQNVLAYGTGAINIDACRVEPTGESRERLGEASQDRRYTEAGGTNFAAKPGVRGGDPAGRFPANVIHDGSDEVMAAFPQASGAVAPVKGTEPSSKTNNAFGEFAGRATSDQRDGGGSAARFFYCAKASRRDRNEGLPSGDVPAVSTNATMREREDADFQARNGNHHPTVKPTDLMRYLCRLVTPPGGVVLDPFNGSGSTGKAAVLEGFSYVGIDMDAGYLDI